MNMRTQPERIRDDARRVELNSDMPTHWGLILHHWVPKLPGLKPVWVAKLNGTSYECETRNAALLWLASVFIVIGTGPEPDLDSIYSERWHPDDKRSYTQYADQYYGKRDADLARDDGFSHPSLELAELDRRDAADDAERQGSMALGV